MDNNQFIYQIRYYNKLIMMIYKYFKCNKFIKFGKILKMINKQIELN